MIINEVEQIRAWSILTGNAEMLYREEYDETLVAWNGILLTKVVAMNLALEAFDKWPTPSMKQHMFDSYKQLYITGFFGDQYWEYAFNKTPSDFFSYLRSISTPYINGQIKGKNIAEVLSWFK